MTAENTADVSCRVCGQGWWVTNPDAFPWDGCPDCEPPKAESLFEPDASPLALALVFASAALALAGVVAAVVWFGVAK